VQRYTIFFITVNAVHVSGGYCAHSIWHMSYTRCCVYSFELLMMGGEIAWNMQRIDSNKEYCITVHLVCILDRIH